MARSAGPARQGHDPFHVTARTVSTSPYCSDLATTCSPLAKMTMMSGQQDRQDCSAPPILLPLKFERRRNIICQLSCFSGRLQGPSSQDFAIIRCTWNFDMRLMSLFVPSGCNPPLRLHKVLEATA